MNKQLFFPLLGLLLICMGLFGGCTNNSGTNVLSTTPNGFEFYHHIKNEGAKPNPGDYAFFHFEIYADDSLLQASHGNPNIPSTKIPDPESSKQQPSPFFDVLPLMSVGDSVTVVEPVDSLPSPPARLRTI